MVILRCSLDGIPRVLPKLLSTKRSDAWGIGDITKNAEKSAGLWDVNPRITEKELAVRETHVSVSNFQISTTHLRLGSMHGGLPTTPARLILLLCILFSEVQQFEGLYRRLVPHRHVDSPHPTTPLQACLASSPSALSLLPICLHVTAVRVLGSVQSDQGRTLTIAWQIPTRGQLEPVSLLNR